MMHGSMSKAELRSLFGRRLATLRRYPQADFARVFGLSAGAVRDLEQGRVLPSRAMVVLMKAIEMDREFMRRAAMAAKDELSALDAVRTVRN